MTDQTKAFVTEKTHDLLNAFCCCKEAKDAANAWLSACGTEAEADETAKYIAELEADIIPIDGLIAFAETEDGAKVFGGAEKAKEIAAHGRKIKAEGAVYCDCPACTAAEAILSVKAELLA